MLLSTIIKEVFANNLQYTYWNEKEFSTLGIVASKVKQTMCTFVDSEKYLKELQKCNNGNYISRAKRGCNESGKRVIWHYDSGQSQAVLFFSAQFSLSEKEEYCRKEEDTVI